MSESVLFSAKKKRAGIQRRSVSAGAKSKWLSSTRRTDIGRSSGISSESDKCVS